MIGLGSNLGHSLMNLETAIERLQKIGARVLRMSSIYRTEPVGIAKQAWFLNQVIEIETNCTPWELLRAVKSIEKKMGRKAGRRNGPRPIDIDILLAEETVLQTPELEIPHPRLGERRFVLVPLTEIAPRLVHPVLKKSMRAILRACPDRSEVARIS